MVVMSLLLLLLPTAFAGRLLRHSNLEASVEALISGHSPVLFEKVDFDEVIDVLNKANFPVLPQEHREMLWMHKAVNPLTGNKKYVFRDLGVYEMSGTIASSDGSVRNITAPREKVSEEFRAGFMKDAEDYAHFCGSLQTVEDFENCENYIRKWKLDNELPTSDESGMMPDHQQACWGDFDGLTYMTSSTYGYQAMIPSTLWVYAVANAATLKLKNLIAYSIAPGIHTTSPKCNSGGCRAWFKREMWGRVFMEPKYAFTPYNFHWLFSRPSTQNGGHSITTGFSETFTIGISGSIGSSGSSIGFSMSLSFTSSYSESTDVQDFSVIENTWDSEGEWNYYQTYPVNVHTHPTTNFGNDWPVWYDPDWCAVVSGPPLALSSHQTDNAVKWYLDPSLVVNKQLWVNYHVHYDAELWGLWCQNSAGTPANPCNVNGEHHHCVSKMIAKMYPKWSVNLIESMNNLS